MQTDTPLSGPVNAIERNPDDFGARDFWKEANAHTMRHWADTHTALISARAMLDWAETLLCNARAEDERNPQAWNEALRDWREQKNGGHKR